MGPRGAEGPGPWATMGPHSMRNMRKHMFLDMRVFRNIYPKSAFYKLMVCFESLGADKNTR
jgi:hypothetical protein